MSKLGDFLFGGKGISSPQFGRDRFEPKAPAQPNVGVGFDGERLIDLEDRDDDKENQNKVGC